MINYACADYNLAENGKVEQSNYLWKLTVDANTVLLRFASAAAFDLSPNLFLSHWFHAIPVDHFFFRTAIYLAVLSNMIENSACLHCIEVAMKISMPLK